MTENLTTAYLFNLVNRNNPLPIVDNRIHIRKTSKPSNMFKRPSYTAGGQGHEEFAFPEDSPAKDIRVEGRGAPIGSVFGKCHLHLGTLYSTL